MVMFVIVEIIRVIAGLYGDGNGRYLFTAVVGEFGIALRNRKLAYDDLAVVEELASATDILVSKGLYKGIDINRSNLILKNLSKHSIKANANNVPRSSSHEFWNKTCINRKISSF